MLRTQVSHGRVQVTIQDNGCGIPDAVRAQVFDAFFTTRPVGAGTGLGLTVARDIVHMHHGTLQLDSQEGGGTRVTLSLPLAEGQRT
ncbi:sensor histidine kinase [Marinobacter sp. X15-166B]|uniref:sensor histidine kinase n=1 Tax=Marinobacter sp. X15-166B TaxID=1897620 RepID=UPI0018EA152B|nr:ATP-binding protein [Marinobacter sp. X15-166B]